MIRVFAVVSLVALSLSCGAKIQPLSAPSPAAGLGVESDEVLPDNQAIVGDDARAADDSLNLVTSISISSSGRCSRGFITDTIRVRVNSQSFSLNFSCRFTNSKIFTTTGGDRCTARSGMCSGFSPAKKVEVRCGSVSKTANIQCPAR